MTRLFAFVRSPSRRRNPRGVADEPSGRSPVEDALNDRRFRGLPDALEADFQLDTADDQIRALFRAALAAAVLYTVQLVPEWILIRDVFPLAAALHFGVVTPALLLIAAFSRSATTPLRRDLLGLAIPLSIAGQVTGAYLMSFSEGAGAYLTLFTVIAILSNASLPLGGRASLWTTAICLTLLAVCVRVKHDAVTAAEAGAMIPFALCVLMTLISAFQRNRDMRRTYLLARRQRLRMAEVDQEARHDPLTGLVNRRGLEEAARKLWSHESTAVSPVAVVLFDVDRFKAYNDLYGHQAGDDCLRRVAATALAEIGAEDDVVARYGGEEFILILPRTPLEEGRAIAERLREAVAALRIPHAGGEKPGIVTASFGVACGESARRGLADLVADADAALYRAKGCGRNRVVAAPNAPRGPKAA